MTPRTGAGTAPPTPMAHAATSHGHVPPRAVVHASAYRWCDNRRRHCRSVCLHLPAASRGGRVACCCPCRCCSSGCPCCCPGSGPRRSRRSSSACRSESSVHHDHACRPLSMLPLRPLHIGTWDPPAQVPQLHCCCPCTAERAPQGHLPAPGCHHCCGQPVTAAAPGPGGLAPSGPTGGRCH